MEYGVPRENGPEAIRRVIEWVRGNRYPVFFPIEMRVTAADDALLSPSHERDTAYIAVHQYRGMEWRPYFEAVEEIMDGYGGRPHWGKRHFQTARDTGAALPALGRVPGRPRRARPRAGLRQRVRRPCPRPLRPRCCCAIAAAGFGGVAIWNSTERGLTRWVPLWALLAVLFLGLWTLFLQLCGLGENRSDLYNARCQGGTKYLPLLGIPLLVGAGGRCRSC